MSARVGELVETAKGWQVTAPTHCPTGHLLKGNVTVGQQVCGGTHSGTHLEWYCRQCGQSVYSPAMGSACRKLNGPAGVRNV